MNETADNGSDVCANPGDPCSLRGAVEGAASGDLVVVPAGTYKLEADENIEIREDITIQGESARNTIVDGQGNQRVFDSQAPNAATIKNLTITGGNGQSTENVPHGMGGGIAMQSGDLTLDHVAVRSNIVNDECSSGGGIANYSGDTLTLTHSEVSDNHANTCGEGGGIYSQSRSGQIVLNDTTISNNSASDDGGAIFLGFFFGEFGPITGGLIGADAIVATNATIAGNHVDAPPQISGPASSSPAGGVTSNAQFKAENTIVSGNTTGNSIVNCRDENNEFASSGFNISDDETCKFTDATDKQNTDPKLLALADNGGQTNTQALQDGSPALNAFSGHDCPADDQRDVTRPQEGACEIGAWERAAPQSADLSEAKTANPTSVTVGQNVTFTLTSHNAGPNTANNVTVTDTLPSGTTFVSSHPSQGSCSGTTNITCSLGTLAVGASATITVVARVDNPGTYTNTATVSGDPADPNTANNSASAQFAGVATPPRQRQTPGQPHVQVAGALAGCARSSVIAKISVKAPAGISRVAVWLGHHRIKTSSKAKFSVRVKRSQLHVGHNKLKVIARDKLGRHATRRVLLTRCRVHVAPSFTG